MLVLCIFASSRLPRYPRPIRPESVPPSVSFRGEIVIRFQKARDILSPYFLQGDTHKVFGWLCLPDHVDPDAVQAALGHQRISVLSSRYFQAKDNAPAPYLRITFGSEESDDRFFRSLEKVRSTIDQLAELPELGRPVG